jgi:hypothetical protein
VASSLGQRDLLAAIAQTLDDRLEGFQSERLSRLRLDDLVQRIGEARAAKSRLTNRPRPDPQFSALEVDEGRACFAIEARTLIASLASDLARVEDAWFERRLRTRGVRAYVEFGRSVKNGVARDPIDIVSGGIWGLGLIAGLTVLALPANGIRWLAERSVSSEPVLHGTKQARDALMGALAPSGDADAFEAGWVTEAYVLEGVLQP